MGRLGEAARRSGRLADVAAPRGQPGQAYTLTIAASVLLDHLPGWQMIEVVEMVATGRHPRDCWRSEKSDAAGSWSPQPAGKTVLGGA